jgi:NAD(P)-dependent dehydrogenase (short-subunit alcohol dehydrogenase family)
VTVNAVAPVALTRMTEGLGPAPETDAEREMRSPRWIAPIVTWLASEESKDVTGRVFEASGQFLAVAEGWMRGPSTTPVEDPAQIGPVVQELLSKARKNSGMDGKPGTWPQPR